MFDRVLNTALIELAKNPWNPKNDQKAEIWSRCPPPWGGKKKNREKRKIEKRKTRSTTAGDPRHLKVKKQHISLTKNYCITISIKIISSIHIFIFKIQVLGSHELKSHCHFWQGLPKNDWINFQSSCICTSMQKIRLFHQLSFETVNFRVPWPDWPHPFLTMTIQ